MAVDGLRLLELTELLETSFKKHQLLQLANVEVDGMKLHRLKRLDL